jgi:hypothetical protein
VFSALALATFARMATVASGYAADPSVAGLLHWTPVVCWGVAGAILLYLSVTRVREWAMAR